MAKNANKIVVIDGKRFRCDIEGKAHTILLHDVDAPKVGEPFTKELAKQLKELIYGKKLYLETMGINWGELVCIVRAEGETESVNDKINSYLTNMKQSVSRPTE